MNALMLTLKNALKHRHIVSVSACMWKWAYSPLHNVLTTFIGTYIFWHEVYCQTHSTRKLSCLVSSPFIAVAVVWCVLWRLQNFTNWQNDATVSVVYSGEGEKLYFSFASFFIFLWWKHSLSLHCGIGSLFFFSVCFTSKTLKFHRFIIDFSFCIQKTVRSFASTNIVWCVVAIFHVCRCCICLQYFPSFRPFACIVCQSFFPCSRRQQHFRFRFCFSSLPKCEPNQNDGEKAKEKKIAVDKKRIQIYAQLCAYFECFVFFFYEEWIFASLEKTKRFFARNSRIENSRKNCLKN